MENEYLKILNEQQFMAATHYEGAALVLSGPGSGKTSVITARALFLIDVKKVFPKRLLTVTFSRAAAFEMRKRFEEKSKENDLHLCQMPMYGTLHGFCLGLLKMDYAPERDTYTRLLCNVEEKNMILRDIWSSINAPIDNRLSAEYLDLISSSISKLKSLFCIEEKNRFKKNIQIRNFDEVYDAYEKFKVKNKLMDFDDMIYKAATLLSENYSFRKKVSSMYDFIQVDEGQDLSDVQMEILKSVGSHGNVFMVSDDDQGIYGFRGANVNSLKSFESAFDGCKKYYLDRNYRSDRKIVDAASSFIKGNSRRYDKKLFSENEFGGKIELIKTADIDSQARFAAEIALANSAAGLTCGILYRNNISALMPLLYMHHLSARKGIKSDFTITGGFVAPEKYEIVKYYLNLLCAAERKKGIFAKSSYDIYRELEQSEKLAIYREMSDAAGRSEKETEYILCFVKTMSKLCNGYEKTMDFFASLKTVETKCNVSFSTVHSAKGLEYDSVVILDASLNEFPNGNEIGENELEEERRLFYVAMTRAKKQLYIVSPDKCGIVRCHPGLFFVETAKVLKS